MHRGSRGLALLLLILAAGSSRAQTLSLRNVTAGSGLDYITPRDGAWIGVALAFVDLDGDLWPDLYIGGGTGQYDHLCINTRRGKFDCRQTGQLRDAAALAIAAGDYDSDGDLDLYEMGPYGNQLLENDGHGHFTDVTKLRKAGGDGRGTPTGTFLDLDGDGRLDLYLGFGDTGLTGHSRPPQVLKQNPDRTFTDVTVETGLNKSKNTLAMIAFDYDGDMKQDLLVTGNFQLVSLFHNEGNGTFADVTASQPMAFQTAVVEGMGLDIADFDGDGDFDVYASNSQSNPNNPGSGFFINNGDGKFDSAAAQYGVLAAFEWGTGWADFDNDTWPDILVVGHAANSRFLYRNLEGKSFVQQELPAYQDGIVNPCVSAAFADYDRDGRVDVVVARLIDGAPPELLHNETADAGNWISIALSGERDPVGALVEVTAKGRVLKRQLLSQTSKGAQNDRNLHFGLGDATVVDVAVTWPSGGTDRLMSVPINRLISIEEGCAKMSSNWPAQCNRQATIAGNQAGCAIGARPSLSPVYFVFFALWIRRRPR